MSLQYWMTIITWRRPSSLLHMPCALNTKHHELLLILETISDHYGVCSPILNDCSNRMTQHNSIRVHHFIWVAGVHRGGLMCVSPLIQQSIVDGVGWLDSGGFDRSDPQAVVCFMICKNVTTEEKIMGQPSIFLTWQLAQQDVRWPTQKSTIHLLYLPDIDRHYR